MAECYPIMNGQAYIRYAYDDPTKAKGKAVDKVRDIIEESMVDRYLESIVVYENSISVILNNGIILRFKFNRYTGWVKGITEVEAYIRE